MSGALPLLYPPQVPPLGPTPPPSMTWWDTYNANRGMPMPQQLRSWTCSICATDWLLLATGLDPYSTREKVAYELGYPGCVDEAQGLKDTQCIVRVLESFGVAARQEWVSWERALQIAGETAFILNSTSWYHFVAGRGRTEWGGLWIANSAMGYRGIYDTLNAAQWAAMPGWQAVYILR